MPDLEIGSDLQGCLAFFLSKAWDRYIEQNGKPPDGSREQFDEMMELEPHIRELLFARWTSQ